MRIPNASPSPPNTWATTSTSGAPLFTIPVTPWGGASSRFSKGLPRSSEERHGAKAGAVHGARECLQRRLSATPVRGVTSHLRQLRQQERRRGVGTGEHIVENVFRAIAERRLGRGERIGGRDVVIAAQRISIA